MKKRGAFVLIIFSMSGCLPLTTDTWKSVELISTRGEKVYVNSLNWGVTGDYQISIISTNKNRLKEREDSIGAVRGLDPFIYSFKSDTLNLYFDNNISYNVEDSFKTIFVKYIVLDRLKYMEYLQKAHINNEVYCVPRHNEHAYPSDMPHPSN